MQSFLVNLIQSEYVESDFHIGLFLPYYSTAKFVTERVIISFNVLTNGTICLFFLRERRLVHICASGLTGLLTSHLIRASDNCKPIPQLLKTLKEH